MPLRLCSKTLISLAIEFTGGVLIGWFVWSSDAEEPDIFRPLDTEEQDLAQDPAVPISSGLPGTLPRTTALLKSGNSWTSLGTRRCPCSEARVIVDELV